jgi:four helix bundle protein
MALQVAEVGFEAIAAIKPLVPRIKRHDRSLADQLVRAASSVALNIGEADLSDPGNQRARFFTAAGSASESLTALRVAVCWGYIATEEAEVASGLLRRVLSMLWKLSRRELTRSSPMAVAFAPGARARHRHPHRLSLEELECVWLTKRGGSGVRPFWGACSWRARRAGSRVKRPGSRLPPLANRVWRPRGTPSVVPAATTARRASRSSCAVRIPTGHRVARVATPP